jgi:hypothetical protein
MASFILIKNFDLNSKYIQNNLTSSEIRIKLTNSIATKTNCDCCGGQIFGDLNLKIIRPCLKIFGVKYIPFKFYSCSITCLNEFKTKKLSS